MSDASALPGPGRSGLGSLSDSLGIASTLVILGVLASWLWVTWENEALPDLAPEVRLTVATPAAGAAESELSFVERAEIAFAAGRVVEPEGDSALDYYAAQLARRPGDPEAIEGLHRVVGYVLDQADLAAGRGEWDLVERYAGVIARSLPDRSDDVLLLQQRARRGRELAQLTTLAFEHLSAGRLVEPADGNAAATYRRMLELDPDNEVARQGLTRVAERLLANAQSALFARDRVAAAGFADGAARIAPELEGLRAVRAALARGDAAPEDPGPGAAPGTGALIARASSALREERLVAPPGNNALELFRAVLEQAPGNARASEGLGLVREALRTRVQAALASEALDAAERAIADARRAGIPEGELAAAELELRYRRYMADARVGRFERRYGLSELTVTRSAAPAYPTRAARRREAGWVELAFVVNAEGRVENARVLDASAVIFERAALDAINRWRFEPERAFGRPVPVEAAMRFTFEL